MEQWRVAFRLGRCLHEGIAADLEHSRIYVLSYLYQTNVFHPREAQVPFISHIPTAMAATFNPFIAGLSQPSGLVDYASIGAFSLAVGTYLLKGKAWDKPDPYHHLWFEKPQVQDSESGGKPKEARDIAQKLEETVSLITTPAPELY